ncbi:MAG: zf-HC2 domain-containing protein [Desulfomonile tiedjei]|nr:zf-HC2 domain-containing protein [Desulfomonile tiedjei]
MNKSDHIDDLRLPYLEGLLSPEERASFEDHVRDCSDCKSKLEETRRWTSLLEKNTQAMCPEPWEIFDQVQMGKDPLGIISSHLNKCHSCNEIAESFRADLHERGVPTTLWARMQGLAGDRSEDRPARSSFLWFTELLDRLQDLFRPVALVPAAVAVALLCVVIFYPTQSIHRTMALSSVAWAPGPSDLRIMGKVPPEGMPTDAQKERLAVVVLLTNFKHPPDQNRIDAFYRSLEPPIDVRERYDVVSPSDLERAVGPDRLKALDDKAIAAEMSSKLGISRLLVLEIVQSGERFGIVARFTDTTTGDIVREEDSRDLTEAQLIPTLERLALSALDHQSARP